MKKSDTLTRIPLANATFVSGEGSLCYEDVIDDFRLCETFSVKVL